MRDYRVGFHDLDEEVEDRALAVEGSVPAWLDGSLYRNGPAKWSVDGPDGGDEADHWFDGLAHVTRFSFDDGDLRYTNRFLRTEAYRTVHRDGEFTGQFSSSGSYLSRLKSMLSGDATDNANVHVARLAGGLVALTETPNWVRLSPDLDVLGSLAYDDDLTAHHVTAHLRRDREAGETWGYFTRFGRTNEYVVFRMADGSARREAVARIAIDRPAYMHSFALTPDHAVLIEPPLSTHPARFLKPGSGGFIDNYDWRPERGTRFLVFERASGELVREWTAPAFFTFHTANAYDAAGERGTDESGLVVDLVAYDDASAVTDLSMGALRSGSGTEGGGGSGSEGSGGSDDAVDGFPSGDLRRYHLPLGDASASKPAFEVLAEDVEMPRFSPEVHLSPYRYVFAQSTDMADGNALVKVDRQERATARWDEPGVFSGEPVFVPRPDGTREDDGVVLSLCLDSEAERSFLLLLDGETFAEVGRGWLPHAVPFGFHGEYFPDA